MFLGLSWCSNEQNIVGWRCHNRTKTEDKVCWGIFIDMTNQGKSYWEVDICVKSWKGLWSHSYLQMKFLIRRDTAHTKAPWQKYVPSRVKKEQRPVWIEHSGWGRNSRSWAPRNPKGEAAVQLMQDSVGGWRPLPFMNEIGGRLFTKQWPGSSCNVQNNSKVWQRWAKAHRFVEAYLSEFPFYSIIKINKYERDQIYQGLYGAWLLLCFCCVLLGWSKW